MNPEVDFDFHQSFSLTMVYCMNPNALAHMQEHTGDEAQWMGDGIAVENRYAPDLSAELCRAGFTVGLPDGRVVTAEDLR